jgi:hypothetical protein
MGLSHVIYLGISHRNLGMIQGIAKLPSALAILNLPIDETSLSQFTTSHLAILQNSLILLMHCLGYSLLYYFSLKRKIRMK